jgi:HK97 family phage portal protein
MAAMGSVGTLFSIVDLMSTSTAAVEWRLWRKAKSGRDEDRTEVTSHLALDVLNRPNPFYSRGQLVEAGQQHVDLVGECRIVMVTNVMGWPVALWPVRPDRIEPIPSATDFLAGYVYTGPDGEKIPLDLDQVMGIQMPNPLDPFRGLGPVQAILVDADSIKYSAAWNLNFFMNGAEPGGIIEIPNTLGDPEFDQFRDRWRQAHQGVSNAHRVALVEGGGKWVDRKYSHDDMQFSELRQVSRDAIREAFKVHGHMLGDADDVNLANATAAEITFARRSTVPRANRWREMLNLSFLPKFGPTAEGLEFDYDSPVAEDEKQDAEIFLNRARGAQFLIASGFDGTAVAQASGLPDMAWSSDAVVHGNTTAAGLKHAAEWQDQHGGGQQSGWDDQPANMLPAGRRALNAAPAPDSQTQPADVDLTPVQEAWLFALNALLATWATEVLTPQRKALVEQVEKIVKSGDLADLAAMTVETAEGAHLLTVAMTGLADLAGRHVVQEAARQGVDLAAGAVAGDTLSGWAGLTADLLGLGLGIAAAREAQRVATPGVPAAEVAHQVQQFLAALSDASTRGALGQALTAAQNAGRLSTMRQGPEAALYADERMDANTCAPCRAVNGRWLGNVSDMAQVERMYGAAGYVDCIGAQHGNACRGTVVALWRPATTHDGGDE